MEQQVVKGMDARFPVQRVTLPLSDAARASLVAVRKAQEAARERSRKQTWRTRAWVGGIVGGLAFGLVVFGARPARRAAAVKTPTASAAAIADATGSATGGKLTAATGAQATAPALPASVDGVAGALPATALTAPSPPVSPVPVAATDPSAIAAADSACAETFGQGRRHLSIDACVQSFAAHPQDGALALRLAQAYHARARLPEAAEWAKRALALDPRLAEGFAIVAHAEKQAGHVGAAADAYQRYLTLAPRGWHAPEARSALRAFRQHPATD